MNTALKDIDFAEEMRIRMRILMPAKPLTNAGDYLIVKKAVEAFRVLRPDINIVSEGISEECDLSFVNSFDGIVWTGGPAYDNRLMRTNLFPLLRKVYSIKPRLYFMSNGWYGKTDDTSRIFEYCLDEEIKNSLFTIENKGGSFTCRDFISEAVLKNIGLKRVKTVGCVAWYDYDLIDYLQVRNIAHGINNIIISDHGMTKNSDSWEWQYRQMKGLIEYVRTKFPLARLLFTFNGGINTKFSGNYNKRILDYLTSNQIEYIDISGSADGFKFYDSINLHIGFRVHSHIYCMSKRIPSILIEEDARGAGTNQTLGLRQIRNYKYVESSYRENEYMIKQVDYYLDDLIQSGFKLLEPSYRIMNMIYHDKFVPFVLRIGE